MRRTRREFLGLTAVALAVPLLPKRAGAEIAAKVVVLGGGFAGATCARFVRRLDPRLEVTLVEPNTVFTACPFSNAVLAGLRDIREQRFSYQAVRAEGVGVIQAAANAVDPQARQVRLADGAILSYDRLVVAPGIDFRWNAIPGYGETAADRMPHAWKAGDQTLLLRRQLEGMADGGLVVIAVPANPYRCPPGPYERASLIAHYLKTRKPHSKVLVLDAKDSFSKQPLFTAAWKQLYPGLLEWVPLSQGGKVASVDPAAGTVSTDFEVYKPAVANIIPPQQAGRIAELAGVADRTGWCPIHPVTFESRLQLSVHVLGDAAIAGAMPKSAFAANAQAKVCAAAVAALLRGRVPPEPALVNTCYSLVAPDYGISVAGVYRPKGGLLADVEGAGGISPLQAPPETRALEARYAEAWFKTITDEVFG